MKDSLNPARTALGVFVFLGLFSMATLMNAGPSTAQSSKPAGLKGGGPGGEKPAGRPGEFVYTKYDALLEKYVKDGLVDYSTWKSAGTADLDLAIAEMAAHPYSKVFAREARLAYLINIYNALTLQSILKAYPVESVKDIEGFFDVAGHKLWDGVFTLDEIEKTLIRKTFDDLPQYHFGLVCGGRGCPPLQNKAFTGDRLISLLEMNARMLVSNSTNARYDEKENILHLSELFRWYKDDFEAVDLSINRVVAPYFTLSQTMKIMGDDPAIEYLSFDWKLNDAGVK